MQTRIFVVLAFLSVLSLAGCRGASDDSIPVTWVGESVEHDGATLQFGYYGKQPVNEGELVPVVGISADGQPVASAMVFVTVLDEASGEPLTPEAATVYAPGNKTGLYMPEGIAPPEDAAQLTVRYRIRLADSDEDFSHDAAIVLP